MNLEDFHRTKSGTRTFRLLKNLKKNLLFSVDLNVAHQIDLANPNKTQKTPGLQRRKKKFDNIVKAGLLIALDILTKSHITTPGGATEQTRARNSGWRIGAFLHFKSLISQVKSASILRLGVTTVPSLRT